jgi:hypothetical protein
MARKSAAALATPTIFDTKRPPPPDGLPWCCCAVGFNLRRPLRTTSQVPT